MTKTAFAVIKPVISSLFGESLILLKADLNIPMINHKIETIPGTPISAQICKYELCA